MDSIIGTWRLVAETLVEESGRRRAPLYGPEPLGFAAFTAEGRMIAAISDGRAEVDGERVYISYCGRYTFDGREIVTVVDGASDPRLAADPQVRAARFEDGRLVLRPVGGIRAIDGVVRELIWERVA